MLKVLNEAEEDLYVVSELADLDMPHFPAGYMNRKARRSLKKRADVLRRRDLANAMGISGKRPPMSSSRGDKKRLVREQTRKAHRAQQQIEKAFLTKDMRWRQVEKTLARHGWHFGNVQLLAQKVGLLDGAS